MKTETVDFSTENPIRESNPNVDRLTTISRYEDETEKACVRSTPDSLLMLDETGEIWKYARAVTFLQVVVSIMVIVSTTKGGVKVHPTFDNCVTCIAASLAVASSIHSSVMEMWINNRVVEMMKKENPQDKLVLQKDNLATYYYVGQVMFGLATILTIAQQSNPVEVVTNSTGLLLIQDLDRGVFSCMEFEAQASHRMKVKLLEVVKDPKYASRKVFQGTFLAIYACIAITWWGA